MQRVMEQREGIENDRYEKGLRATRHEALVTTILKIAKQMKKWGVEVEVHTPIVSDINNYTNSV